VQLACLGSAVVLGLMLAPTLSTAFAPVSGRAFSLALAPKASAFLPRAGLTTSKGKGVRSGILGQQPLGGRTRSNPFVRSLAAALATHSSRTEKPGVSLGTSDTAPDAWEGDLIFVPMFAPDTEDKEALAEVVGVAKTMDGKTSGAITEMVEQNEFKGGAGQSVVVRLAGSAVKKVCIVGMGKADKFDVQAAMKFGNTVATTVKSEKAKTAAVALPSEVKDDTLKAIASTLLSSLYHDTRFKSDVEGNKPAPIEKVEFLDCKAENPDTALAEAPQFVEGVRLAKDLVSAPANFITPTYLASVAKEIGKDHGLTCKILEKSDCEKMGMGSYLGVSQGASEPPKFIHLTYKPKGEVKKKVAIIGKGLTFDSGGYNLKAGAGSMIEMMKFDMGGSAATLGAAKVIGQLKPEGVEAHFIVAACENMVSADAMRPGDILTASNGKTIEVLNTDAEGRLTLADALIYAEKTAGAEEIIDIATLTGACIVALGQEYAGWFSNDDDMADSLRESFKTTGEKGWQLPLPAEYLEDMKSKIADLKNIGGKGGGTITAALFLKEFVEKAKWAHLDIAGPVWSDKAGGATGYGVKVLSDYVIKSGK